MAAKVVYTVKEDKQAGLQKQLGCMNGFFHLLDRSYIGLHRHWRNQNRLPAGQGENGVKELKKSSEKAKERNQKKMITEKNQTLVESSRNSFSSSGSSTTFSSFDCSKRVQTEWQLPSEPTSPILHKKQPEWSEPRPDIRDVVKDSMTRVIRVRKDERAGPIMKHVDSPRPFIHQNPIQYDRKDRNLAKTHKTSSEVKKINEISRFSCDERESQYSLKSTFKVNELPRLSLDSKQSSKKNSMNESRTEPGRSNKSSSGIVARLMGLDSLTDSIYEIKSLKIKPAFGDQLGSCSPKVHSKKPALQQHGGVNRCSKKPSVYGEMEKRLSALDFKTSGKDHSVNQIVEAIQMTKTKTVFEKNDQPGSPTVKSTSSPKKHDLQNRAVKPAKMATEPVVVTGLHYANHKSRKQAKGPTPRLQRSKIGIDKQCFNGTSYDSSRIRKQSNLKTRHPKIKPINPMQSNDRSCMCRNETRNLCQDCDPVNFLKSESKQEVTQNNFSERLIEDKTMVELAKPTMELASPVSVLDAFYVEDTPSPVKNKSNAFNDYDNLRIDETGWNQVGIYKLATCTDAGGLHQIELLNSTDGERATYPCKSTNGDHKYIRDILSASGFLKDPDYAIRISQLHSGSMIKPELFHILEKTNAECHKNNPSSKSKEKVRRKMIFDSVNDILFHKLAMSGFSGKRCARFVEGEKLLTELWFEIDKLQSSSEGCIYDEDDGIKILVSADLYKSSQDWDKYCYDVPGLVLDIERLIFKDLIDEVVNADAAIVQGRRMRHCRRLFSL